MLTFVCRICFRRVTQLVRLAIIPAMNRPNYVRIEHFLSSILPERNSLLSERCSAFLPRSVSPAESPRRFLAAFCFLSRGGTTKFSRFPPARPCDPPGIF